MDKGRRIRPQLDETILSQVRSQSGEVVAIYPGLQPGQLLQKIGSTRSDKAMVADKRSDETHQDRWAFGAPCQEAYIPTRRGYGDQGYVR